MGIKRHLNSHSDKPSKLIKTCSRLKRREEKTLHGETEPPLQELVKEQAQGSSRSRREPSHPYTLSQAMNDGDALCGLAGTYHRHLPQLQSHCYCQAAGKLLPTLRPSPLPAPSKGSDDEQAPSLAAHSSHRVAPSILHVL